MRMSMNHDRYLLLLKQRANRIWMRIHDFGALRLLFALAIDAHAFNDGLSLRQGLLQKCLLPLALPDHIAKLHIAHIVGAQGIAMRDGNGVASQMNQTRVR